MSPELGPYAFLPDLLEYVIDYDKAMLAAALKVPERAYMQDHGISMGSLHKLLVHAMASQSVWVNRFRGTSFLKMPDDTDFPTRKALAETWPEVHNLLRDFLHTQTAETLGAPYSYTNLRGEKVIAPLGQLLMHVTDHASYHRGQQNTLLKLASGKEASFYIPYYQWSLDHKVG